MSGSTLREAERPMRTMKLSSTTRIRLGFGFFIGLRGSVHRHLNENFGSLAGLAIDFELGTHRLRPLAHIEQSKMPGGERRNKAAAVVCYGQVYVPGSVAELNRDLGRAAMLDRVGDSFLSDSQQIDLERRRQTYWTAIGLEVDLDAIGRRQRLDDFCQCRDQVPALQQMTAQIPYRAACLEHAVS